MPVLLSTRPDLRKHTQRVELDGVVYRIVLTWRQRLSAWYLNLYRSSDDAPIALGRRICPGWSPLFENTNPLRPPGAFVIIGPEDYQRTDLGDRVQILYYTQEELA